MFIILPACVSSSISSKVPPYVTSLNITFIKDSGRSGFFSSRGKHKRIFDNIVFFSQEVSFLVYTCFMNVHSKMKIQVVLNNGKADWQFDVDVRVCSYV